MMLDGGKYQLLAGLRRLKAVQSLGQTEIEVNVVFPADAEAALRIEISENEQREPFTYSEKMDYARLLEDIERAKAKERMLAGKKSCDTDPVPQGAQGQTGKTRDIVASKIGMGKTTYDRAKYIAENAPEAVNVGAFINQMVWEQVPNEEDTYAATIKFEQDANYTVNFSYADPASNEGNTIFSGEKEGDESYSDEWPLPNFTVDDAAPKISVEYSEGHAQATLVDALLEALTFGFYNDGSADDEEKMTVSFTATDETAGIDYITYHYEDDPGSSYDEEGDCEFSEVYYDDDNGKDRGREYSNSFVVDPEFRGWVRIVVTDISGNEYEYNSMDSETNTKDPNVYVVDDPPPKMQIALPDDIRWIDGRETTPVEAEDGPTDKNTVGYYKNPDKFTATVTVTEANFFDYGNWNERVDGKDVPVQDVDIWIYQKEPGGASFEKMNENGETVSWSPTEDQDTYTATIELPATDGEYYIEIGYTDRSGNPMIFNFDYENGIPLSNAGEQYTSNTIVVDRTAPVIEVEYKKDPFRLDGYEGYDYYDAIIDEAAVTVTEQNFWAGDMAIIADKVDITGATVSEGYDNSGNVTTHSNWGSEWDSENKKQTYTTVAPVKFDADARYTLALNYTDLAGNPAEQYEKKFVVDTKSPTDLSISANGAKLNKTGIAFYQETVTIKLEAADITAGINYFEYWLTDISPYDRTDKEREKIPVSSDDLEYSADGKTASYTFTISPEFRGKVYFKAYDRSGHSSETNTLEIVVDSIKPTRAISLNPDRVVGADDRDIAQNGEHNGESGQDQVLYFNRQADIKIQIDEMNFYAGDVIINVLDLDAKTERSIDSGRLAWSSEGSVRTTTITLPAPTDHSGDGDYKLLITYTDRSWNEMSKFESDVIVIDTTLPVIQVDYPTENAVRTVDGRVYYDAVQTVTVSVNEHNFRADEVAAKIIAEDVAGNTVPVSDFAAYLRGAGNWNHSGDIHIATFTYTADANYTFDVAYTDLAVNASADYRADAFTVDKTAPYDLRITYSQSLLDTVLSALTFGFYSAPPTVTISGSDDTSGIYDFTYSYRNSEGVSGVNAQRLNALIQSGGLSYSGSGRNASASFRIPEGTLTGNNQFRGTVDFYANDRADNRTDRRDSKVIVVDSITPSVSVTFNDPVRQIGNVRYYAGDAVATIRINEANFFREDVRISVTREGGAATTVTPTNWTQSGDVWTGTVTLAAPATRATGITA